MVEPIRGPLVSADPDLGAEIFADRCKTCHTLAKAGRNLIAPNLWGTLGSDKASVIGFRYSKAFKRLTGTWTLAELNAYLAAPMAFTGPSNYDDGVLASQ
jgi:cytochrome c